jgi:hypothetical protein
MSTLKTPDNATLTEPIVSPRRELRRRQANGRKIVATSQSRGARQAKERTMPGVPKPEPKVDEPEKRGRGRPLGFRMSDEHRSKIRNSSILNALIAYAQGEREMSVTQVSVGLGLLKRVLPDLRPVTPEFSSRIARESCRRSHGMQTDRVREPWA